MKRVDNWSRRNIPLELWAVILTYLPVKSVLRFRAVSKSWKSIIEDPNFSSVHLKHCRPNNTHRPHLLFCEEPGDSECYRWVRRSSKKFRKASYLEFPAPSIKDKVWRVCNGVDGLILLRGNELYGKPDENILLWNPSIKKAVYLPAPNISFVPFGDMVNFCLLYDAPNNDYKVVMIHYARYTFSAPLVDVFSLKTMSWKRVVDKNIAASSRTWRSLFSCACIGGTSHWLEPQSSDKVISFDVTSNMFWCTPFPTTGEDVRKLVLKDLIVLSGSVVGLLQKSYMSDRVSIWAMKRSSDASSSSTFDARRESTQYCWSKMYEFHLDLDSISSWCIRSVTIRNRDVLLLSSCKSLRLCDLETGEWKVSRAKYSHRLKHVITYVESLLLLGACDHLRSCTM